MARIAQEMEEVYRDSVLNIQHNWKGGKTNHLPLDCDKSKIMLKYLGKSIKE